MNKLIRKRYQIVTNSRVLRYLRLTKLAQETLRSTAELYYIAKSDETPRVVTLIGLLGVLWVVVPYDLDFIPYLGWVDDLTILRQSTRIVKQMSPAHVVSSAEDMDFQDFVNIGTKVANNLTSELKNLGDQVANILLWLFILFTLPMHLENRARKAKRNIIVREFNILSNISILGIVTSLMYSYLFPSRDYSLTILSSVRYTGEVSRGLIRGGASFFSFWISSLLEGELLFTSLIFVSGVCFLIYLSSGDLSTIRFAISRIFQVISLIIVCYYLWSYPDIFPWGSGQATMWLSIAVFDVTVICSIIWEFVS